MTFLTFFVLTIFLLIVNQLEWSVVTSARDTSHVQLEQHHIDINLERNRYTNFKSIAINTEISSSWGNLPETPARADKGRCLVPLKLDLKEFEFPKMTLCLFKDELEDNLFLEGTEVNILGEDFDPKDLYLESEPVTGYVRHNPHSKVSGYLVNGKFYGTLRLFDNFRLHHVVFYIEPAVSGDLYDPNIVNDGDKNAILFEYIAHTSDNDPPKADDYDDAAKQARKKRHHQPPPGNHTRQKRQTKDQEAYSHENTINADDDIIHTFKFKTGITKHNMFDMRREDVYVCELCIWIQPNFAKIFGLGGGLLVGAAEVIDLIKFLNWIFRTLDFDQDGLPERIGFTIKSLYINDRIRVTVTDAPEEYPRKPSADMGNDLADDSVQKYSFSTNTRTISTKSALALATKHMQPVFRECCASLGFVFHNMAPALSTTNLRGLCTNKNVAVISGMIRSNKVAKFDVFRALIHAVGHLFGGHHDDATNLRCHETPLFRFLNPFIMHPVQQVNVGMRLNSFRMSTCSKDHITQFLSSNGIHCLVQVNQTYCGNGFQDDGEECDCGSLWQCHLQEECCGEGDTMFDCKITNPYKSQCLRPRKW